MTSTTGVPIPTHTTAVITTPVRCLLTTLAAQAAPTAPETIANQTARSELLQLCPPAQ
jgi:hypothetical protein